MLQYQVLSLTDLVFKMLFDTEVDSPVRVTESLQFIFAVQITLPCSYGRLGGLLGGSLLMEEQHLEKMVQTLVFCHRSKKNVQVLVSKYWVGCRTCFVITITIVVVILQEPTVLSQFKNLTGEILRLFNLHHKHRHPVKHISFPVITKALIRASNYIKTKKKVRNIQIVHESHFTMQTG